MIYLWTEDSGAGFHFWKLVNEFAFESKLNVCSMGSNQEVLDSLRILKPSEEDVYFIAFDIVYDNMDVMNKYAEILAIAKKYPGQIEVLDITCFEHLILSFSKLVEWTGCAKKDKILIREEILKHMDRHRIAIDEIEDRRTLQYLMGFKKFSTEKVLKSVTYEITENDDWSVKGHEVGKCWFENCCVLDNDRIEKRRCGCDINSTGKSKFFELIRSKEIGKAIDEIELRR